MHPVRAGFRPRSPPPSGRPPGPPWAKFWAGQAAGRAVESSGAPIVWGGKNEISGNLIVLASMRRVRRVFTGIVLDVHDVVAGVRCPWNFGWQKAAVRIWLGCAMNSQSQRWI